MTDQPPAYDGPVDPAWPPPYVESDRADRGESLGRLSRDAALIVGGMAVLGVVSGFLWAQLVDPPQLIRFETDVGQDELELAKVFAADGWYAAIAALAGLASGLTFGFWRTRDPLSTVLLVLLGCAAGAGLMWVCGVAFGPDDPSAVLRQAPVGTRADAPLQRPDWPVFLAWPVSALAGLLLPLLSRSD